MIILDEERQKLLLLILILFWRKRSPGLGAEVIPNRPLIRQQRCCDPAGQRNEYSWAPEGRGVSPLSMFDVPPMRSGKGKQLFRASCFFKPVEAWLHRNSIALPWWSTLPSTHPSGNASAPCCHIKSASPNLELQSSRKFTTSRKYTVCGALGATGGRVCARFPTAAKPVGTWTFVSFRDGFSLTEPTCIAPINSSSVQTPYPLQLSPPLPPRTFPLKPPTT